ncbi:S-layer homology domain-containing protein [Cohnella sp. GCM10020058]|uniref:S-layer homology domain-containing protein n=1 Tax=Cohnella sp. GCM10020058 TaxID=3317330 RepID=UPI003640DEBA
MTIKMKKWVNWVVLSAMAFGLFPYSPAFAATIDYSQVPELLITELVPDTNNVGGSDGYEAIEIYNNTSQPVDYSQYSLIYNNGSTDASYGLQSAGAAIIPARQAIVLWVTNDANGSETTDKFNANYGLSGDAQLVEGTNLFRTVKVNGMANTGKRSLTLKASDGSAVAKAAYDVATSSVNKGIVYNYPVGSTDMVLAALETTAATPGTVLPTQVPDQPSDYVTPTPAVDLKISHTPAVSAPEDQDLSISAAITDNKHSVTAAVYYQTNLAPSYTALAMSALQDGAYAASIPHQALTGASSLQYYIEAADGTDGSVASSVYNVNIQAVSEPAERSLLITELVPDTANVSGADAYEFIEVYNNTDAAVDFGGQYSLVYRNGGADTVWAPLTTGPIIIPSRQAIVFWVMNAANTALTEAQFNANFATSLTENTNLFRVNGGGGMANAGPRDLLIKSKRGKEIVSASYQDDAQTQPDKGIFYRLPTGAGIDMTMMDAPGTLAATPGTVDLVQVTPPAANEAPVITHSPVTQGAKGSDILLTANVTNAENADVDPLTVFIYYKTASQEFFSSVEMKASGSAYQGAIPKEALVESGIQYYIEAKDKANTVKTATYDVAVDLTTDLSKVPPILITELLPDSVNVQSSDDGEFIELYNNSDKPFAFKDYKLYYRYPDSGTDADVIWPSSKEDIVIQPGKTLVLWVINSGNSTQTVADFNAAFKTSLVENVDIIKVYSDGMANSAKRGIVVGTNTHVDIVTAYYDGSVKGEVAAGKGIYYKYPSDGSKNMLKYSVGTKNATPGTLEAGQAPAQPVHVEDDTAEPAIADRTGKTETSQKIDLDLVADVTDDTRVLSVAVYFKSNLDAGYTKKYLTQDFNDTMYHQLLTSPDLLGRKYVAYYFEASDGQNVATSKVTRVNIKEGQDRAPLRLNLEAGDIVSGKTTLKGTSETAGPDTLELKIDGQTAAGTYDALEDDAVFAFDVKNVNYYFKNAVTMGQEILYTFLDPITAYTTLSYPIETTRLKEGANLIAIRAGTKSGPFDDRPEENKDDFEIRNVRLVMPDGTVLYDPLYAAPTKELKMGDSAGKFPAIEFNFTIPAEQLRAKAYDWDTTALADGVHTIEVVASDDSRALRAIQIDNTAPVITPSVADGQTYRGAFTLDASISDALAGVASTETTLDGNAISLPVGTSSGLLTAGEHVLVIKATDKVGNVSEKTVRFSVPNENPAQPELVSPANGGALTSSSAELTVKVTDPTDDPMKVSFYKGFKYDANSKAGFIGYQGAADVEPPKTVAPAGETAMTADEYAKIGAADGQYLTKDAADAFPYHRFNIKLDESVKTTDRVDINWQGKSLEGRKVSLYAWQPVKRQWIMLDTEVAGAADFALGATVQAGEYNDGGSIAVMVQDELPVKQDPYDFSFIWMSDTQYYSASYPWIYEGNTQWIVDHQQDMNIKYVIHTGDIVDNAEQAYQWDNAEKAMKTLDDAKVPYGVLAGNHDVSHQSGDYSHYYAHYGEERFTVQPTYGGSYKNNRGHYDLISAGGVDFIIVYMGWGVTDEDIDWMNQVVADHPDRKAILAFHEYMLVSNNRAPIADKVFERVVVPNKNVIMTLSGHYHDSETLVDKIDDDGDGVADREVYQILADYQGAAEGGLGYIRLMQFDIQNNKVHMKSYSPYLDDYNYYDPTEYPGKDEYDMNVDLGAMNKEVATDYFGVKVYTDELIGQVNNAASGKTASVAWKGLVSDRYYQWYVKAEDAYSGSVLSDIWGFATGTVIPENPGTPDPGTSNPGTSNPGTGTPGGSTGQNGSVLTVKADKDGAYALTGDALKAAIAQAAGGVVEIKLDASATGNGSTFSLKLDGAGLKQGQQAGVALKISTPQGTIEVPAGAIPDSAVQGADAVTLSFELKSDRQGQGALLQTIGADAVFKATGQTFELNLSATTGTTSTPIHEFKQPITVRRTLTAEQLAGIDKELAGVYYVNGSKLEYMGGRIEGNELVFTTKHFSSFALLEYRKQFADMIGNWANDYVRKLAAKHIVTGVSDTSYAPSLSVTRADFATIIVRALGYDQPQGTSKFTDVSASAYYAGFVSKAAELGLIQGDGARFRPQDKISREEAIVILVRAYESTSKTTVSPSASTQPFADLNKAAPWASASIGKGQALGLIGGKGGNLFDPKGQLTRAEIAKLVYQLLMSDENKVID